MRLNSHCIMSHVVLLVVAAVSCMCTLLNLSVSMMYSVLAVGMCCGTCSIVGSQVFSGMYSNACSAPLVHIFTLTRMKVILSLWETHYCLHCCPLAAVFFS
jgi:hypothetical protein